MTIDPNHEYLKPKEAAYLLRCSERTLARWRAERTGPSYHKHGGSVLYVRNMLRDWVSENMRDALRSQA